jgi:hypothetical protein
LRTLEIDAGHGSIFVTKLIKLKYSQKFNAQNKNSATAFAAVAEFWKRKK